MRCLTINENGLTSPTLAHVIRSIMDVTIVDLSANLLTKTVTALLSSKLADI